MPTATMRVNVYADALRPVEDNDGPRVYLHQKQVRDEQGKDLPFKHHAIRILIGDRAIHAELGKNNKDDDTAAVTFWYSDEHQRKMLIEIFERALKELNEPGAKY